MFRAFLLFISCGCLLLVEEAAQAQQAQTPAPSAEQESADPAAPRTLVAVLFLATGAVDETLADNLTEVLVATIALQGQYAIVGREQFGAAMGFGGEEQTLACAEDPVCLGRIGTLVGAEEVVLGALGERSDRYLINLTRINVQSAQALHRVFRSTPAELSPLIAAVRAGAEELMQPPPGAVRVTANVDGATITIDGEAREPDPDGIIRGLEPGTHSVVIEAEGYVEVTREFDVARGDTADLAVSLSRQEAQVAPPRWYQRWWVWTIVGVVVVGAGAATAAALLIDNEPPDVHGNLGTITFPNQ